VEAETFRSRSEEESKSSGRGRQKGRPDSGHLECPYAQGGCLASPKPGHRAWYQMREAGLRKGEPHFLPGYLNGSQLLMSPA
jgi:hypothetical protein